MLPLGSLLDVFMSLSLHSLPKSVTEDVTLAPIEVKVTLMKAAADAFPVIEEGVVVNAKEFKCGSKDVVAYQDLIAGG